MPDSLGAAPVGEQVLADRYELRELIGHGGMAEVHRAHDRLLDRTVAVKIFRPRDDPAAQRRFDDEGRALARVAHPGLVAIFDVGTVDDRPFLVMEFVEGTSVQSRLLDGPLPLDEVRRIGAVLADALAHAHQRGVIHRDVKPSNIMLDRADQPHLTDFGIALLADSPRLTSVHEILGTPAYLAPEQLLDTEVGPPADVYALGLVLLECLSGELEYASGSNVEIALSRLSRPPRVPDDLPPALFDLLTAMTATEPVDRPSAEACARGLLAGLDDPGGDADVVPLPVAAWADEDTTEPAIPVRHGPRWRLLAASVAVVAAVVAALVFLVDTPHSLTGRTPTASGGGTQSGSDAGPGTHRATAPRGARTPGSGVRDPRPANGLLVVKEHSASATTPTTAARLASSAPGPTRQTHATPPAPPPQETTAAPPPPATESSAPPVTTAPSTEPSSANPSSGPSDDPQP